MSKQSQKLNIDNVRQKDREKKLIESKAKEIEHKYKINVVNLKDKFNGSVNNQFEQQLANNQNSGILSRDAYNKGKQENQKVQVIAISNKRYIKNLNKNQNINNNKCQLSFVDENDESDFVIQSKSKFLQKRFKKDRQDFELQKPTKIVKLDKSEQLIQNQKLREQFMQEYMLNQATLKETKVKLKYQYWDGIHQEQTIQIKLSQTLNDFLKECLIELGQIYQQLSGAPVEGFLFVKGDYIVATNTFTEKGLKTCLLDLHTSQNSICQEIFKFQKSGENELEDVSEFKIKIVEKNLFEKQKHIFPFMNWKAFDPNHKQFKR